MKAKKRNPKLFANGNMLAGKQAGARGAVVSCRLVQMKETREAFAPAGHAGAGLPVDKRTRGSGCCLQTAKIRV